MIHFFVHIKMSYQFLIENNYSKKKKINILNVEAKKKLLNIILLIKKFYKKMQKISICICQKKKKQKKNMEEIDIKKWEKIKRTG